MSGALLALGAAAVFLAWAATSENSCVSISRNDDLDDLEADFRAKVESILAQLRSEGYEPLVWETERTKARQAWLYASGRSREGSIVTWTMDSSHIDNDDEPGAEAVDIIDGRPHPTRAGKLVGWGAWADEYGDEATDGDRKADEMGAAFFKRYGQLAEAAGLTWGGNWSSPDLPHAET